MKKPAFWNTPAGAVISVGVIILVSEFFIMVLIESLRTTILKDVAQEKMVFEFVDPILLIAIVFPALYILIFRPMHKKQIELELASNDKIKQGYQDWINAMDAVSDSVFLHDQQFRILRCNKAYQQCAGLPFKQIIGQPYYDVFPKTGALLPSCLRAMEEGEEEVTVGGAIYRSRAFSIHDKQCAYLYSVHTLEDITESKRTKDTLRKSKDLLQSVMENAPVRIFWKDRESRYLGCNTWFAKDAGHSRPDELTGKTDFEMGWKDQAELYRADDKAVMESGNPKLDFEESQTTPDGNTIWLRTSKVPLRDESNQVIGILGIYEDITGRKRLENESLEANNRIRSSLEDAIGAIAATLEQRDPYTAGHQRRVAELASAIGGKMGLAREVIEGIHFGGLIHDIGKISVPAEILGKPGRLTDLEYSLIKIHAEDGYQIVKNIHFPWPVADMVRQHHERLDGTGYPQGLKGDQIVLEARILAVADVVEAMSANRPYRLGLGMDLALGEITRGRGTLFDPVAVDACLRVIKEEGFVFSK